VTRILLAATGGTIATAAAERGLSEVRRGAAELRASIPQAGGLDIEVIDVARAPSHAITFTDMARLAEVVAQTSAEGAVVTHGTDTIEETAYALSLMLDRRLPVVLTGAMRSPDAPGADGPANLAAALCVACDPRLAALGPVVVVQDEIHLARHVTKVHTSRVAAFASPGLGPVGWVSEGRVHLSIEAAPSDWIGGVEGSGRRIEVIWTYAGAGPALLEACLGADGVVVAGTGGGHVPPRMMEALKALLAARIPVVLASRTGAGPTLEGSYGGRGSESELRKLGVIGAGMLSPVKARLRLLVALELGIDPRAVFPVDFIYRMQS
jgi:L-asparaginase